MEKKRLETFSKSQQLLVVGSELVRAGVWQNKDREKFISALERALGLVDSILNDRKWEGQTRMILGLREEIAKFYIGKRTDDILMLYHAL